MRTKRGLIFKVLTILILFTGLGLLTNCESEQLFDKQKDQTVTEIKDTIPQAVKDTLAKRGINFYPGFDWCSIIPNLSGYYTANDGGHYYVRHIGNTIYWFGEHPSGIWANVFKGTISGKTITGVFRDVPKGSIQGLGNLTLTVKCFGTGFIKTSGNNFGGSNWSKTTRPSNLPPPRSAGFGVRNDSENITGRWVGDDGGIYYIRQIQSDIVWFGERNFANGRPTWSNVAWGNRFYTQLWLDWVDVPKGDTNSSGILRGFVEGPNYITLGHNTGGFGGSKLWR